MRKTLTQQRVERVLARDWRSPMSGIGPRDSDRELIIQLLQYELGANLDSAQVEILRSVSFESITRARRKMQEQGLYMPSPDVARARRLKGYEVEQVAPTETPAGLQERIERSGP